MSAPPERRLLLVVGVGRSGTSLLSGIVGQLGLQIPKPEVRPNSTNPRGFGEPRWVVDFHTRLLRDWGVVINDARPSAWAIMAGTAESPELRAELGGWLAGQLAEHGAIVVKDPRTAWFLPLWQRCAQELGMTPDFATMLRHPAETLTSALRSYGDWMPPAGRAGAWVNVALETEQATRGARRVFIRYDDLLADWRREVTRAGERLGLSQLAAIDPERAAQVDEFVDPGLHRNRVGWDDLEAPVPAQVRALAETAWARLQPLAGPDGEAGVMLSALDETRAAYGRLYADAEAIAHSTIAARRRRPAPPPTLYLQLARRIPARYRKLIRRAIRA